MTKKIDLNALTRKLDEDKDKDYIPAVLYGAKVDNQNLKMKRIEFEKTFAVAGEASLIDLTIDEKEPVKVVVKTIQKHPVKDNIIHADFYQVDMNKKITAEIILNFINEAPAIKEFGAVLIKDMDAVDIECLPGDLINHIDVDLSTLKNLHDSIRLEDLDFPDNIEVLSKGSETIASVIEPRIEVEPEPVVAGEGEEGEAKEGEGDGEAKEGEAKPVEGEGESKEDKK